MLVNDTYYQTIWLEDPETVQVIDQRRLPFQFEIMNLCTVEDVFFAIREMVVRGAPLIGVTASWGIYLAIRQYAADPDWQEKVQEAAAYLSSSRPTAINLAYAIRQQQEELSGVSSAEVAAEKAKEIAQQLAEQEVENSRRIGEEGLSLIRGIAKKKKGEPVHILTHCNAGWLACIDYGTATAAMYLAHDQGIDIHVWVDETRPRNQGARLTSWELSQHGIPNTIIADNAGGLLMPQGKVDLVLVGSDRTAANGDVANKIGTYLKALAAWDNNIPFYVALPLSTIDLDTPNGVRDIPTPAHEEDIQKLFDHD